MKFEKPLVIGNTKADAAIIFLHGLGASGQDFVPIVPYLGIDELDMRYIFPHAPVQPVTLNSGFAMPSWFDVFSLENDDRQDMRGMKCSENHIRSLISSCEDDGIDSKRIFLAGFSQGGALSLYTGLRYQKPLAGIIGLSTLLGGRQCLEVSRHDANKSTSVLLTHGVEDDVIKLNMAEKSRDILCGWNYAVDWHTYQAGHTLTHNGMLDIGKFILQKLEG